MLGCVLELGLAVVGIYLLATGKAKLPAGWSIKGPLVRYAGIAFIAPLPLIFLISFALGFAEGFRDKTPDLKSAAPLLTGIEVGVLVTCCTMSAILIGMAYLKQLSPEDRFFEDRPPSKHDHLGLPTLTRKPKNLVLAAPPRQVCRERPDMDPTKGYAAIRPAPETPTTSPPTQSPQQEYETNAAPSAPKESTLPMAVYVVVFALVTCVGAILFWPR